MVAGSVIHHAGSQWNVTAVSRTAPPVARQGVRHVSLDLCDSHALETLFDQLRPDAVIHTAAIADIDYCETHRDEAQACNVAATQRLADRCRRHNSKMVFCSTDTVFDGRRGAYTESDPPAPLNFYAQTKVLGEACVLALASQGIVARLALVMGFPFFGRGNSFLVRLAEQLETGRRPAAAEDQFRTPIDAVTLGHALLELAAADHCGIVHLAGATRLSRYAMAVRVAEKLGYSAKSIAAVRGHSGSAPRPADVSLDISRARRWLQTPMLTFQEGLERVIQARNSNT